MNLKKLIQSANTKLISTIPITFEELDLYIDSNVEGETSSPTFKKVKIQQGHKFMPKNIVMNNIDIAPKSQFDNSENNDIQNTIVTTSYDKVNNPSNSDDKILFQNEHQLA